MTDVLVFRPPGTDEVLRIDPEGKVFWKGMELVTDADFKQAVLDLIGCFTGR